MYYIIALLSLTLLVGSDATPELRVDQAAQILRHARPARVDAVHEELTSIQHKTLARTLPRLIEAVNAADKPTLAGLAPAMSEAGFEVRVATVAGESWAFVLETSARGAGGYVFRLGAVERELVVQAPHSYHDLHTAEIAFGMFNTESIRGFYFNTAHREHCDVAHVETTPFELFTTAFVSTSDSAIVLQVHGFDNPGVGHEAIVSNGTKSPDQVSVEFSHRFDAALYGPGTRRYGATTNTIGAAVRAQGANFVHLELSREAREGLRAD